MTNVMHCATPLDVTTQELLPTCLITTAIEFVTTRIADSSVTLTTYTTVNAMRPVTQKAVDTFVTPHINSAMLAIPTVMFPAVTTYAT